MAVIFAMDRDKRWERVKLAYDAMVNGTGEQATDATEAVKQAYQNNITDEFIKPTVITNTDKTPVATIKDGDVAICFNFRTDRCREITEVLTQQDFPDNGMHKLNLDYTTMTQYDHSFKNVHVVFENDDLTNTLGDIIAQKRPATDTHCRNREIPARYFLFQRWQGKNHLKAKKGLWRLLPK